MASFQSTVKETAPTTFGFVKPKKVLHRACDLCRRRKARCDGYERPGNRCTTCSHASVKCTYFEATRKRPSPEYVEALENRLANMEKLFSLISPHVDLSKIPPNQLPNSSGKNTTTAPSSSQMMASPLSLPGLSSVHSVVPEDDDSPPSDDDSRVASVEIKPLSERENSRFYGKSSGFPFVQYLIERKRHGEEQTEERNKPPPMDRRPEFWALEAPWWASFTFRSPDADYHFPEPDLLSSLVDCYFTYVNIFYPLIHQPSFRAALADDLQSRDDGFATTVILVCAVGCRFSTDPRVMHNASDAPDLPTGWQLFRQVRRLHRIEYVPHSIYDLQVYALAAIFLECSPVPQAAYILLGEGLRFAQDIGVHRRKLYGPQPSIEGEQWKRTFWVLVVLDRIRCATLGRPCEMYDEVFDTDFPIECDDEYWSNSDSDQAFKQPPGKPSIVTSFVCLIKLTQILGFALRTIYTVDKSKAVLGYINNNDEEQWDQRIVAWLDSALSQWANIIPSCLRWDPNREDINFFRQSAVLYTYYYELQIIIHKPYTTRKNSSLSFSSTVICGNAARSCCQLLYGSRERLGFAMNQCVRPLFTCGVMLLFNTWKGRSLGQPVDSAKELEEVSKCQVMLRECEKRWLHAGRFVDILAGLMT